MQPHDLIPVFVQNLQVIQVFPPQIQFIDTDSHCLGLYFQTFRIHLPTSFPPPLEFVFSIWNCDTLEVLTEEFSVPISSLHQLHFQSSDLLPVPEESRAAIFKDFPESQYDPSRFILVCRLILNGKLQIDDMQSIPDARIPYAFGVIPIDSLLDRTRDEVSRILKKDVDNIEGLHVKKEHQNDGVENVAKDATDEKTLRKVKDEIRGVTIYLHRRPANVSIREFIHHIMESQADGLQSFRDLSSSESSDISSLISSSSTSFDPTVRRGSAISPSPSPSLSSFSLSSSGIGKVELAMEDDPLPNEHAHLNLLRRISSPPPIVLERTCLTTHVTSSQSFARRSNKLYVTIVGGMFPNLPSYVVPRVTVSVRMLSGWQVNKTVSIGVTRDHSDPFMTVRSCQIIF
jgi:hypothetical protein